MQIPCWLPDSWLGAEGQTRCFIESLERPGSVERVGTILLWLGSALIIAGGVWWYRAYEFPARLFKVVLGIAVVRLMLEHFA
jgi:hypothetical protein